MLVPLTSSPRVNVDCTIDMKIGLTAHLEARLMHIHQWRFFHLGKSSSDVIHNRKDKIGIAFYFLLQYRISNVFEMIDSFDEKNHS